jgi:hypothetical protein
LSIWCRRVLLWWQHVGSTTAARCLARLYCEFEQNCADNFQLSEPPDYQRAPPSTFVRVSLPLISNASGPSRGPFDRNAQWSAQPNADRANQWAQSSMRSTRIRVRHVCLLAVAVNPNPAAGTEQRPPKKPMRCGLSGESVYSARTVARRPEKAGVGGSIPSLATIFSTAYSHHFHRFGSIWFQN